MATKIIDIYNSELKELVNVSDINDNYVILMNKHDNSVNSNIIAQAKTLKGYFTNESVSQKDYNTLIEQIGLLESRLNKLENENDDLKKRLENIETLISL